MYEISEAHEEGRVSLRPDATRTHETGEDMIDSYGWYTSSDIFGDIVLQAVEYGWLDEGLEDKYVLKTAAGPLEGTEVLLPRGSVGRCTYALARCHFGG